MKIRLNDRTTLAFIKSRVDPLTQSKNGQRKYLSSVDSVFKELFEKKGIGTKIVRCTSYRELYDIISKIDGTALFEILRRNATYKNLGILIRLDYSLEKGDLSKKEEKKLSKLRAEGIKVFIDNFDIRRAKDDNDFSALKSYVKKSKRSFIDDDDDFDFTDSLFDDDFYDDDEDEDEDDIDAFEAFASRKSKTSKKSRIVDDDDDEDEDEEDSKLDKLIDAMTLMTKSMSHQPQVQIQQAPTSDFEKKLTSFAELVDRKFSTQEDINERFADTLDDQGDKLDAIIQMISSGREETPDEDRVNPLDDIDDDTDTAVEVVAEQPQQGQIYRQQKN